MATGTLVRFPSRRPSRADIYLDDLRDARDRAPVPGCVGLDDNDVPNEQRPIAAAGPSFDTLTRREWAVLRLLAEGLSDRDIGVRLNVSRETVRSHMAGLLKKLGAESRLQALVIAVRHGRVEIR